MQTTRPVWTQGVASRQAHTSLPPNTFEREMGAHGFNGPSSHFYHRRPPTDWSRIEGPLRPRAFELTKLDPSGCPLRALTVLASPSCAVSFWKADGDMDHLVRNADGDMLVFLHQGACDFFSDFGHLAVKSGDYLLVPRGTMWRLEGCEGVETLIIEATERRLGLPDKGMLGNHALFDSALFDVPVFSEAWSVQCNSENPWNVVVKRRGELSSIHYDYNPLDALGWKGDLAPVRFNVRDFRPVMSHRYHLPPSVHATFVSERFMVSTFAPRPFETSEDAIKVPFFHNNDDYDEVIFYHRGEFMSRDNIGPGAMTLHPSGITHGPQPGALQNMLRQSRPMTNEYAVMIDVNEGLTVGSGVPEIRDYAESWKR